jgi:hypothetical protein
MKKQQKEPRWKSSETKNQTADKNKVNHWKSNPKQWKKEILEKKRKSSDRHSRWKNANNNRINIQKNEKQSTQKPTRPKSKVNISKINSLNGSR